MEFDFKRNRLTGTVMAEFSMDHEVFGRWLTEELGDNLALAKQVLAKIELLMDGELSHWHLTGGDLTLAADNEQVRIFVSAIDFDEDFDIEDGMNLYDMESESYCGLEDFHHALSQWISFLEDV